MINPINENKIQNIQEQSVQQVNADAEKIHGRGGPGGHAEKVIATETSEKSYRSHFRHMKSPEEVIRQQRMMQEMEVQEQISKAAEKEKKKITKGEEVPHQSVSERHKKEKQRKGKQRHHREENW